MKVYCTDNKGALVLLTPSEMEMLVVEATDPDKFMTNEFDGDSDNVYESLKLHSQIVKLWQKDRE